MKPKQNLYRKYLPFSFTFLVQISSFFKFEFVAFQFSIAGGRPQQRLRLQNTSTSDPFNLRGREHSLLHHLILSQQLILSYHFPSFTSFMFLQQQLWVDPQLSSYSILEAVNTFGGIPASGTQSIVVRWNSRARPLCSTTSTCHGEAQEVVSSDKGRLGALLDTHCSACKNSCHKMPSHT